MDLIKAEFALKLNTFYDLYIGDGGGKITPQHKEFIKQITADFIEALNKTRKDTLEKIIRDYDMKFLTPEMVDKQHDVRAWLVTKLQSLKKGSK